MRCIKIYKTEIIGEGVRFSRLTDPRFKVNRIAVSFYTDINDPAHSRADYAVVPYILVDSCEKYPDYSLLSLRFSELYGATLSDSTTLMGDSRCSCLAAASIDDRFALDGESIEHDCCELLLECLLHPLKENGVFSAQTADLMRGELLDSIDSVINDKRAYAAQRGAEFAYKGEAWEYSIQGTREEAEKITAASAYSAYQSMLTHGRIEITAVGCSDFAESKKMFAEAFSALPRGDIYTHSVLPSALKAAPESVVETMPMQQAVLRMYFKAPDMDDRFAGSLLSMILGGMTTSRFFSKIREQQSLCYYCSCFSNRFKRVITAYAGVDPHNAEKTRDAILAEFEDIRQNGVTEDELERARLEVINDAKSVYDSVNAIASWYSAQILDENPLTPEEFIDGIMQVTPQRIREACAAYSPDTFYALMPQEDNQ